MTNHDCSHLLHDISDYLDGEASAAVCAELEKHLAECENCRVVVNTTQKTIDLVRELPQPGMPHHLRQRLVAQVQLEIFTDE
jgi:mycothiol system anti-sigma-R factor